MSGECRGRRCDGIGCGTFLLGLVLLGSCVDNAIERRIAEAPICVQPEITPASPTDSAVPTEEALEP